MLQSSYMRKQQILPFFTLGSIAVLMFPALAHAQTIGTLIASLQSLIQSLVPVIIGIALVGFLYGLAMYIFKAGDEKATEQGRQMMFWGVIALFIMVSIWGIVQVLQTSLFPAGIDPTRPPDVPTLPTTSGSSGGPGQSCDQTGNCD